jgi:hypothetical protein
MARARDSRPELTKTSAWLQTTTGATTTPTKARIRGDKRRGDCSEIRSAYVCIASIVDWVVKVWSVRGPKGVSFKLKREAFRES